MSRESGDIFMNGNNRILDAYTFAHTCTNACTCTQSFTNWLQDFYRCSMIWSCVWMKSAHRMSHFQANVYPLSFAGSPSNSYLCSLNLGSFTYLLSLLFHLIVTKRNVHSSVSGQIDLKLVCSLIFVVLWSVKLPIDQMGYLSFLTFGKNHYFVLFAIHPLLPQALTTASNLLILLTIKHKLHQTPIPPFSNLLNTAACSNSCCWTLSFGALIFWWRTVCV